MKHLIFLLLITVSIGASAQKRVGPVTVGGGKPTLTKSIVLESPTASESISFGGWYTPVAITITEVKAIVEGTSPSVTYNVAFGTDITSLTNVFTSGQTVTSTTTGTAGSGFNDQTVPANSWFKLTTGAMSGTVTTLAVQIKYTED